MNYSIVRVLSVTDRDVLCLQYKVITPREGQVIDLLYAAEKVCGLSADRMMLCELSQAIVSIRLRDLLTTLHKIVIMKRVACWSVTRVLTFRLEVNYAIKSR